MPHQNCDVELAGERIRHFVFMFSILARDFYFIVIGIFQMVTNFDYDLTQAVEILDQLIANWDNVVAHLYNSRRISTYRFHMHEVCIL